MTYNMLAESSNDSQWDNHLPSSVTKHMMYCYYIWNQSNILLLFFNHENLLQNDSSKYPDGLDDKSVFAYLTCVYANSAAVVNLIEYNYTCNIQSMSSVAPDQV